MSPLDAIAIAAEAISWLALPLGLVLLIAGLARRSWSHRYVAVKAVVTGVSGHHATLRWFGEGGALHESTEHIEDRVPTVGDARTIWVHPARPDSMRIDDPTHDGRVLLTIGGILTAVGVIAIALSFVLPLL
ncbi:MAG: hypothetical protein Q7J04_04605 [Microcella sp.]|nr:hypothetical protein [Microcella sp.]